MSTNIEGKVVVLTGGSAGLGEDPARYLAARGAGVVLGARRRNRLHAIVEEIRKAGGRAHAVTTDVTKRTEVENLAQEGLRTFGRVDVVVNNAGIMPIAPLEALKVDEWEPPHGERPRTTMRCPVRGRPKGRQPRSSPSQVP
jgi:NADP-dependent 3-hydroxy acid dehydrogenase YdfG